MSTYNFQQQKIDCGGPPEFGIEERHITEMCEIRPGERVFPLVMEEMCVS
jgi:hypothetical protein